MKVILKLETGNDISEIPLEMYKSVVIGRANSSSHKVKDQLMSGEHCKITLTPGKLEIADLESKNGTYLNGLRVDHSQMFLGDEVKVGGSKITIISEKMDPGSVDALTFPGAARDRQSHGLQLDFTGARMINQGQANSLVPEKKPTTSANKELEVRKKANSRIKLSKQEIKLRNKKQASLASTLDVLFILFAFAVPLISSNLIILLNPTLLQQHRLSVMFGAISISVGIFLVLNFKLLKFTIGEKIAGIQKLFNQQDR